MLKSSSYTENVHNASGLFWILLMTCQGKLEINADKFAHFFQTIINTKFIGKTCRQEAYCRFSSYKFN